jgi:uncharacterized BrkB/YihY/UPF0761 family membrane protein
MTLFSTLRARLNGFLQRPHVQKIMKDNVGVLATIIAWNALTSLAPVIVGVVAISGLLLQGHVFSEAALVNRLSLGLEGALSSKDLAAMVRTSREHTGLLGLIGVLGVLWGGSNIGGAISTAFQPIFEVSGRSFLREKILDIAMIFVMASLMMVVIGASTFSVIIYQFVRDFPLSGASSFVIGIVIGLFAAFILFFAIYAAFPNTQPRLKIGNVWRGAAVAAVLFELLSLIWPIYAHFSHFNRYGAVLLPILLLTAWLYFFALITVIGAEVAAIGALDDANREHRSIGPEPANIVPQHEVLRRD